VLVGLESVYGTIDHPMDDSRLIVRLNHNDHTDATAIGPYQFTISQEGDAGLLATAHNVKK